MPCPPTPYPPAENYVLRATGNGYSIDWHFWFLTSILSHFKTKASGTWRPLPLPFPLILSYRCYGHACSTFPPGPLACQVYRPILQARLRALLIKSISYLRVIKGRDYQKSRSHSPGFKYTLPLSKEYEGLPDYSNRTFIVLLRLL